MAGGGHENKQIVLFGQKLSVRTFGRSGAGDARECNGIPSLLFGACAPGTTFATCLSLYLGCDDINL